MYLFDPYGAGFPNTVAAAVHELLRKHTNGWRVHTFTERFQEDGFQCGIWVTYCAAEWAEYITTESFHPSYRINFEQYMVIRLMGQKSPAAPHYSNFIQEKRQLYCEMVVAAFPHAAGINAPHSISHDGSKPVSVYELCPVVAEVRSLWAQCAHRISALLSSSSLRASPRGPGCCRAALRLYACVLCVVPFEVSQFFVSIRGAHLVSLGSPGLQCGTGVPIPLP